jgi:hypothetical protein
MRLAELLVLQDEETIHHLVLQHLGAAETYSKAEACLELEGVIRSPKHVRAAVYNLRPPGFLILEALLENQDHALPLSGLREWALGEMSRVSGLVSDGQAACGEHATLYRRMLLEAWRSDAHLDASEISLLGVLRREVELRNVDHFLLEHHGELSELWNHDHTFLRVMTGIRSAGLALVRESHLVVGEDLVPLLHNILGLEASSPARRRLFERLAAQTMTTALGDAGLRQAGSKEDKLQRLVDGYVQPSAVLLGLALPELRDLCRELELNVSGAKDDLAARIVRHFATGADQKPPAPEPPPPPHENRLLGPEAFAALFQGLRGQDLTDILTGIGSGRVTGSKETLIRLVVESRFCEQTLLLELDAKQLERLVSRLRLKTSGPKREVIQRVVSWYAAATPEAMVAAGDNDAWPEASFAEGRGL